MGDVLVRVRDLRKDYGSIRALDGISFDVSRGDILGFLGPNGAGKTTAMKLITGFIDADSGTVVVAGHDVASDPLAAQRRLGYLPEHAPAYSEMTVDGFLRFVADARNLTDPKGAIDRVVDTTALGRVRHQTVETLSRGFKRRVGLAQALIHDPEILILDEPTDGLDPVTGSGKAQPRAEKRQNGRANLLKIPRCNSLGAVDRLYPHVAKRWKTERAFGLSGHLR